MSYSRPASKPKGYSSSSSAKPKSTSKSKASSGSRIDSANTKISSARYDSIPRSGGFGSKTVGKTFVFLFFLVCVCYILLHFVK